MDVMGSIRNGYSFGCATCALVPVRQDKTHIAFWNVKETIQPAQVKDDVAITRAIVASEHRWTGEVVVSGVSAVLRR